METIRTPFSSGADVQGLDDDGWSALDGAAWFDAPENLQALLDHSPKFKTATMKYNVIIGRCIATATRH